MSAETAAAVLAGARDGDLALALERVYSAVTSPWQVPAYRFDLLVRLERAGTISLRVSRAEELMRYVGHVGYGVEEKWRGQGLARRALSLLVPLARAHNLNPLWIGCNPDNHASRRTLEGAGACFVERVALSPKQDRYWRRGEREKDRYRLDLPPG